MSEEEKMAARGSRDKKTQKKQVKDFANIHQEVQDKVSEMSMEEKMKFVQEAMKDQKNFPKEMKDKLSQSFLAQKEAKQEMDNALQKSLMKKMFGIGESRTDDGDQSPVKGSEAQKLKFKWAGGMDWDPDSPFASPWMKILSNGDIDAMLAHIKNKTDKEIRHQLELRETELNFSALFHVCKGAMTTNNTSQPIPSRMSQPIEFKPKHVECLCKLLDLGANIHARDFAGFTPLHYCVTKYASPTSLKLAKILLKRGADPNAVNRLGCTPLGEPVMGMRTDCVKLLLDYGADPTIVDNDGCTIESQQQAQHRTMKPLFVEARRRRARQMREEAKKKHGGNLRMCEVCGEVDTSRCMGCFLTRYCGIECQKADWDNHKEACKEVQSQYVPVKLVKKDNVAIISGRTGKVKVIDKDRKPAKENFVVKIQIPFDDVSARMQRGVFDDNDKKVSLSLYDEKKTVVGDIEEDEPSYKAIVEKIRSDGVYGDKGFFYAILDKKKNLKINTSKILPPEIW